MIEGQAIEDTSAAKLWSSDYWGEAYHLNDHEVLRTQTTATLFQAMPGREPPVRLLTAGRVFCADPEDRTHLEVFHQADLLCIESEANLSRLKRTFALVTGALLGTDNTRRCDSQYDFVDHAYDIDVKVGGEWSNMARTGTLKTICFEKRDMIFVRSVASRSGSAWNRSP